MILNLTFTVVSVLDINAFCKIKLYVKCNKLQLTQ